MIDAAWGAALAGGVLIGASASLLWAFDGKIAGVSGMLAGLFARAPERDLRASFVLGLVLGGIALLSVRSELIVPSTRPLLVLLVAGLLVGVGTRLSGGCTSGHGVCGVSRGAKRSLIATAIFMTTGALSAPLARLLWGAP